MEAVRAIGGWAGVMLGSCAPHQDFCAQLCHSGACAMYCPRGQHVDVRRHRRLIAPPGALPKHSHKALSTSTIVTQPHRSVPFFPGTLFSPVSHLQCHNLSLSP